MPAASTVFLWLAKHPEFSDQYGKAREAQADALSDECLDIAASEPDVARARLMIDTRKWFASKMKPKKYGDRQAIEHAGKDGGPIQTISKDMTPEEASRIYREFLRRTRVTE